MEIDHIFICTENKAPAGALLTEFGLSEGAPNTHPGQGTANRRFYFQNLMLELLWAEDIEEVQSERTKPMRLYERCLINNNEISPFGIGFRPTTESTDAAPFAAWDYHPVYLPDFLRIQVADNTPLSEPMYFYLSFAKRQDESSSEKKQSMEHNVPFKEVTSVKVHTLQNIDLSEAACIVNQVQGISIMKGNEHLLEIEFDNGVMNESKDFRPDLPLTFKW